MLTIIVSANKTVLIVEDNENLRDLLTVIIKSSGYEAVTASNGQDGVEKALAERPDLIFMDIGLPKLDGIEATRQIKSVPSTKDIPVVILTAFSMAHVVEGVKAGAVRVLQKPASVSAIRDILTEYLSERLSALM